MTTQEVANKLVEYCRKGDFKACYDELYAQDAWSLEPRHSKTPPVQGMEAFAEKGKKWNEAIETFHGAEITEPVVAGDLFSIGMTMEITYKGAPGPMKDHEICMYEVKYGKIVKEQFFYPAPPEQG